MKKLLMILLLFLTFSISYANATPPASFNGNDLTVSLECVRIKQGTTVGNQCYRVKLQYDKGLFGILDISSPFSAPQQDYDQTFDLDTYVLNIPYIEVGNENYLVDLELDAVSGKFAILNLRNSPIHMDDGTSGETLGSCLLDSSYARVCYNFKTGISREAIQVCTTRGGSYSTDPCPNDSVMTCKNVHLGDLSFDIEHYGAIMNLSMDTSMQIYNDECSDLGGTID